MAQSRCTTVFMVPTMSFSYFVFIYYFQAEKSQKGTRKMLCIIVLALLVVGAMVVYIALKFK